MVLIFCILLVNIFHSWDVILIIFPSTYFFNVVIKYFSHFIILIFVEFAVSCFGSATVSHAVSLCRLIAFYMCVCVFNLSINVVQVQNILMIKSPGYLEQVHP
jgi:hypothetical protein